MRYWQWHIARGLASMPLFYLCTQTWHLIMVIICASAMHVFSQLALMAWAKDKLS